MNGEGIRFGDAVFDPGRRRLSVAGRHSSLDRSSAAILQLLISEAGNEVGKDRLLETGWPGRLVHENSLAKAISRLRQGLGPEADTLETVHGYGYRLAAEPRATALNRPARGWLRQGRWPVLALPVAALALVWIGSQADHVPAPPGTGVIKGEAADSIGRVLWVDDHPQNNIAERRELERRKIAVYQVATTEEALQLLAMYEYDAVISDMNRHDKPLEGLALVRTMREREDRTPFFLYTVVPSRAQRQLIAEAGGQGATVTPAQLYAAVVPVVQQGKAADSGA